MNAFALHLPERRGLSRWTLAGVTILIAHAVIVAAVALWYARGGSPSAAPTPTIPVPASSTSTFPDVSSVSTTQGGLHP